MFGINELYDAVCTMKRVIEENDRLKAENAKLKADVAEYHQRDIEYIKTQQDVIGDTLKAIFLGGK